MKGIAFALIILLVASGCLRQAPPAESAKGEIVIGFVDALTGDGASYGVVAKNAVELATEEINARGGIDGAKLKVVYEDGKCNGKDAATATQKLINVDQVKVILGWSCSGEVLGAAPITEKAKVILLSGYASNPDISKAGDYVFRTSYSDTLSGEVLGKAMGRYKKVAALMEATPYAEGVVQAFKPHYPGEVVGEEKFLQEARDMRTQITKLLEKQPEALLLSTQTGVTGGIAVKQLRELGYQGPLYSTVTIEGPEFLEQAGNAAEGVFLQANPEPVSNAEKERVFRMYRERYGKDPAYDYSLASNWDAVRMLAEGLKRVGNDADQLKAYLYGVKDYDGLLGRIGFDGNGDVTGLTSRIKVWHNGKVVAPEAT